MVKKIKFGELANNINQLAEFVFDKIKKSWDIIEELCTFTAACSDVQKCLIDGEQGCPVKTHCYYCGDWEECQFFRTGDRELTPRTYGEAHLALAAEWQNLIILKQILQIVTELQQAIIQS
jgi:hypothetical protein